MSPPIAKPCPLAASYFNTPMTEEKKDNTSGKVQVIGDKIIWSYQDQMISVIDLNEVVVIGEYTYSDGPWFDDWFLVFVLKDGQWKHIPWYAYNIDELTQVIRTRFQPDFEGTILANSKSWNSVVRHPTYLKNQPLFELTPTKNYKKPKNFLQRLQYGLGFGDYNTSEHINLTDSIKKELNNASR